MTPTVEDLLRAGKLVGVAVVHDVHGTGEVIDVDPDEQSPVIWVEYGEAKTTESHLPTVLDIDREYYAELGSNESGFEYAVERGLVVATDGGEDEPDHEVELTDRQLAVIRDCLDRCLGRRPYETDEEIIELAEYLPEENYLSRVRA